VWTYGSFDSVINNTSQGANWFPLNPDLDTGGPWDCVKSQDTHYPVDATDHYRDEYRGYLTVSTTRPSGLPSAYSIQGKTDDEMNALGTTAIARTDPTSPAFEMSTAIGELLSDGIPTMSGLSLLRERAQIARGAGKEYLNHQFGWLPLVNDVQSLARAVKDSHSILESYRKGSDKKIRVGYSFPSVSEDRVFTRTDWFPLGTGFKSWGSGTLYESYSQDSWFSGAFKYHIPVPQTTLDKFNHWLDMADHLLGVKVTPETLWNLAPWSWAVDWFTNTGDILSNVASLGSDSLAMQYGYVMNHARVEQDWNVSFSQQVSFSNWRSLPVRRHIIREYKQRRKATPFGFGVDMSALSGRQIAILAALGLSRT